MIDNRAKLKGEFSMKVNKQMRLGLISTVIAGVFITGCTDSKEKERKAHEYVNFTQVIEPKMYIPGDYSYSESWHGTQRGGAALRTPSYEHALVSPYAVYDPTGQRYADHKDQYSKMLLTSVANSAYAKGNRGTLTETPSFCGENTRFISGSTASRSEYLQIKERYCSTPGYRLSQHEVDVLNGGEPKELRDYRVKMYVDNQSSN